MSFALVAAASAAPVPAFSVAEIVDLVIRFADVGVFPAEAAALAAAVSLVASYAVVLAPAVAGALALYVVAHGENPSVPASVASPPSYSPDDICLPAAAASSASASQPALAFYDRSF